MNAQWDGAEQLHFPEPRANDRVTHGVALRFDEVTGDGEVADHGIDEDELLGPDMESLVESDGPRMAQAGAVAVAASELFRNRHAGRLRRVASEEFAGMHLRLLLARVLLAMLPIHVGGRVRALGLRLAGFKIGHGTIMAGMPTVNGGRNLYKMLRIGSGCWFNVGCVLDLGAPISIGNKVSLGQGVVVLTGTHEMGLSSQRAGRLYTRPVSIGDGAWLGARCTIFPGVQIGAGAVVAAGAVVTQNVPANMVVAGVPAHIVKRLL
jgi:maltose O-acetyltransferase